ncbi:Similar to DPP10: Inactive dipeptidyl peptidase 10 (Homo sapiens) [Cotesia congregata]|uniref:Venom dipeptidyl peptidase 4 n=1 Tax=Cotesia congregata TaxID=51543 RepID=A0A8J2H7X7_COTCN|nr:Similar to DPP10: Inactive dipeptidyl peptidase 10 (Homo sapiens) [Cotesia congregata]
MADHDNMYDDEELVSTNPNQRNWRGILIALLVIIAVLALIVTSVVVLTPPDEGPRVRGERLRLSEILSGELSPLPFNGTWVSNRHICYRDAWGGISLLDASNPNGTARSLMPNETFRRLNPTTFSLSSDHRYILLAQNVEKLFRFTYLAQYLIYDINTRDVIHLTPNPEKYIHPYLLHAQWTPRGHGLIMVHNYDIYYKTSPTSNLEYRVTNTALPGILSNGLPDWLYEEEILRSSHAIWMSKDGHMMLYASFNDSLVEEMHISWFGEENKNLYPETWSLRYPRPGTPNPQVKLHVADLADPKNINIKTVKPPAIIEHTEHYFTTASWISLTEVSITWLTRAQNVSVITVCKSPLWHCQEIQRISESHGWVDVSSHPPLFSLNSSSYITIAPVRDGPAGFFKHIVWVNVVKKQVVPLTHGRREVVKLLSWDHENNTIYFLGIPAGRPGQRHLYKVSSVLPEVGSSLYPAFCITCPVSMIRGNYMYALDNENHIHSGMLSVSSGWSEEKERHQQFDEKEEGNKKNSNTHEVPGTYKSTNKSKKSNIKTEESCQYHNAIFSPGNEYFVLECLGPGVPTSSLYKIEAPVPRFISLLQNNTLLRERIAKIALPQIKTFPVQISGGYNAQVRLYLPPGLREEEITRYPMVVQVYGGPGSQLVTDMFKIDWNTFLASKKNMIVAQIDGRGSGGQGYKMLYEVYYRLGTVEIADQLEVTEYLRDSLHFVDKRRVAVWGWSYGGFVSALALAEPEQNVFQCGISVAPIVSWKLYNSAYAERYMGSPNVTSNYKGYAESDVYNKIEYLSKKMFYLIQGTADDNVQFQQSMTLSRHLAQKGILFRQQVYPDVGHNLSGVTGHLYLSMAQFLDDCFIKQVPVDSKAGLGSGGADI